MSDSTTSLKQKLQQGCELYGVFCSTPAPLLIELLACAGFDFVVIDLEHTLISAEQLDAMLIAAKASGIDALVRVPADAGHWVVKALDAGAKGIVFPRVQSPAQAQSLARLCRYAPEGARGLNVHRHMNYGSADLDLAGALKELNQHVLVVAMIEDDAGLSCADDIAATDGVDVLLEGAADLSQSLGLPWQTRHPRVKEGVQRIASAAAKHQKIFCALPRVTADHRDWQRQGVSMFVVGDDRGLIRRGFAAHLEQFKNTTDQA